VRESSEPFDHGGRMLGRPSSGEGAPAPSPLHRRRCSLLAETVQRQLHRIQQDLLQRVRLLQNAANRTPVHGWTGPAGCGDLVGKLAGGAVFSEVLFPTSRRRPRLSQQLCCRGPAGIP
jgi:hypothetical protein